eukprot:scaffold626_cov337-Pavlova_lutheri.AAC.5
MRNSFGSAPLDEPSKKGSETNEKRNYRGVDRTVPPNPENPTFSLTKSTLERDRSENVPGGVSDGFGMDHRDSPMRACMDMKGTTWIA